MAFRAVVAQGICPACFLDLGNDAIAHANGGENHPLHRRCMQTWIDVQKIQAPICFSCSINVTSIETSGEALVRVAEQGDLGAVKIFMKNGPFFVIYGLAVYGAAQNGHYPVVDELLSKGGISNDFRGLALEAAAKNGHCEVVERLLSTSLTSEHLPVSSIKKSLAIAKEKGYTNIVAILEPLDRINDLSKLLSFRGTARSFQRGDQVLDFAQQ